MTKGLYSVLNSLLVVAVVAATASSTTTSAFLPQIPSLASFIPHTSQGTPFILTPITRIIVDSKHGTQGSPSALDFAKVFRTDLASVTSYSTLPGVEVLSSSSLLAKGSKLLPVISVVIDPTLEYKLYNGKPTSEGYELQIAENTVTVKANAAIGAWWGLRTLVQQAALVLAGGAKEITFPLGNATDSPGWEIRGFMLDAGRHWFDTDFLGLYLFT